MPFGSNFTLGKPAQLKPNVGENPALDYKIGRDARMNMANGEVSAAMRGVADLDTSKDKATLTKERDQLIQEREALQAELSQLAPSTQVPAGEPITDVPAFRNAGVTTTETGTDPGQVAGVTTTETGTGPNEAYMFNPGGTV